MEIPSKIYSFWFKTEEEDKPTLHSINWTVGNTKYEISAPVLETIELGEMVPHCLNICCMVERAVSNPAHKGPSLFAALARSMSHTLETAWQEVVNLAAPNNTTTMHFNDCVLEFIAAHAEDEDAYYLSLFLRQAKKPRSLRVQQYYYQLQERNTYIDWMPGKTEPLTELQLKQAIYHAMPSCWQDGFIQAGRSVPDNAVLSIVLYFRKQENRELLHDHLAH